MEWRIRIGNEEILNHFFLKAIGNKEFIDQVRSQPLSRPLRAFEALVLACVCSGWE